MVVHEYERRRIERKRALDDLSRVDRRVIDRAFALDLVGDENILAIKEENSELFGLSARHGRMAIVQKSGPGAERRFADDPRSGKPERRRFDDLELRDRTITHEFLQSLAG